MTTAQTHIRCRVVLVQPNCTRVTCIGLMRTFLSEALYKNAIVEQRFHQFQTGIRGVLSILSDTNLRMCRLFDVLKQHDY